jgi:phosphoribosylglycinamide formyltransferase-1
MDEEKFPIVVLISGNGSNLQAIIDAIDNKLWPIEIKAVISNKADAYGLQRAQTANIPTAVISHKDYDSRENFDHALQQMIDQYQPKLVVLAGFMRILTPGFVQHYAGKMINIHPSLLPKFKGLETHQRALETQEKIHGCTVHYVTEELDSGNIIAQMECEITPADTVESLQEKVHALEHQLLPEVIFWIADKRVQLK